MQIPPPPLLPQNIATQLFEWLHGRCAKKYAIWRGKLTVILRFGNFGLRMMVMMVWTGANNHDVFIGKWVCLTMTKPTYSCGRRISAFNILHRDEENYQAPAGTQAGGKFLDRGSPVVGNLWLRGRADDDELRTLLYAIFAHRASVKFVVLRYGNVAECRSLLRNKEICPRIHCGFVRICAWK